MWVCVHDTIFGSKSRKLASMIGCSQDEAVGLLVRLWVWGLNNCDRDGQVMYADRSTISDVLVQGLSKDHSPEEIVNCLIDCEYLDVYENEIFIHDWYDWQRYWYSYKDRKDSDNRRKRDAIHENTGKKKKGKDPVGDEPADKTAEPTYPDYFETWWSIYPRKTEKQNAFEKYNTRKKEGFTDEVLLKAANNYAAECKKNHTEARYIKHPATFLSSKAPFRDYVPRPDLEIPVGDPMEKNPFKR